MKNLTAQINSLLTNWGMSEQIADKIDESIIALLTIATVIGVYFLFKIFVIGSLHRYVLRSKRRWVNLLIKQRVVYYLILVVPAITIYFLLPLIFVHGQNLLIITQRICLVFVIMALSLTANSLLLMLLDLYNARNTRKNHPLKGLVQILQVALVFVGGILCIAVLLDKSPTTLLAGLGASAAVLMLVFRDSILGFVAGIQLAANDMIRIGDWVEMPDNTANGTVEEITLNTVKIRNWDNTISTIPPYTLVNDAFRNWRGMQQGEGRRVSKNINIDLTTIKFCSSELLDNIRSNVPLMSDYTPTDGETPTNAQLYRAYIERYLNNHKEVNQAMDLIVSQKESNGYGLPIQVYFFVRNKVWKDYERIQSDIFDHLLAVAPTFQLQIYQSIG